MSTLMNSSSSSMLVFPTFQQQQPQVMPKRGPLVVPYCTASSSSAPSSWYKTALTTTTTTSHNNSKIPSAQNTARALLSTVSSSNSATKLAANGKQPQPQARSKATVMIHRAPSATMMKRATAAPSLFNMSSSHIIPKVLPASLPLQVGVGMASACYWRGMWYILDDNLYPENGAKSALASLGLGTVLLAVSQPYLFDTTAFCKHKMDFMWPKTETLSRTQAAKKYLALYGLGTSCILIWRGAWVGCDVIYEGLTDENPLDPKHLTISGLASHGLALVAMIAMGRLHCVLGPPYHGSLTYKDHDMLNTKNLRKVVKRTRATLVLPLLHQGSKHYNRLMRWLPSKTFSVRKI